MGEYYKIHTWIVIIFSLLLLSVPPACGSSSSLSILDSSKRASESCANHGAGSGPDSVATRSNIKHLVVVIQENHSFDSYFGNYCKALPGSNPTCTLGPECCEAGPAKVSGYSPQVLTDQQNLAYDPDHSLSCELEEIHGGKMDQFIVGGACSHANNFAYGDATTLSIYWNYAANNALADRYFQPSAGASSENDMYFARAAFVFTDNSYVPNSAGSACYLPSQKISYTDTTVADLLVSCGVSWAFYAEGYQKVLSNPAKCLQYPDYYDPGDNPFEYYKTFQDNPLYQKDYTQLSLDISGGILPAVSFVKALGVRSEHPGISKITDGERFVSEVTNLIQNSAYRENTLLLVVPDESGGFYDHIAPPLMSPVDNRAYGVRIPLLAIGYFAQKNQISHVTMEHSSIVRFIEWNFLGGVVGQLGTRDATVNGIGSLLDPSKTGNLVP